MFAEICMSVNGMKTREKNVRMYRPRESVSGNICIPYVENDLAITYNLLNLPKEIKKSGTVVSKYIYLSDGSKVSSYDAGGNGYMYFGTARFTLDNNVPTFESIPFSGGRIVKTSNGYEPQYYLTDHLGSTRAIVNNDGQTVEATFDYTPFGVQIVDSQMPTNSTEYRFSGKELQNISDYEIYDFGARRYFPKYAVWGSVDPLSETYYPITPYAYCANNPVNLIDPDGRMFDWVHNLQTGEFEWMDNVVSQVTTPDGYSYVGSNSDDILRSMNIYLEYQQLTDAIVGLDFIGGDGLIGAGVISPVDIELTGNIAVSVEIGFDAGKATTNNVGGLYFKGINVSGTMSQQSIVTSPDISSLANGTLQVTYGDRTYYESLKVPKSGIRSSTSTVTTAEIMIPDSVMNQSGYFYEAKIFASRINQSGITSNVDFVWKLGRNPVFRKR